MIEFNNCKIERATTDIFDTPLVLKLRSQLEDAGYDVNFTNNKNFGILQVGTVSTKSLILTAMRNTTGTKWVVRYDQLVFDDNYSEQH